MSPQRIRACENAIKKYGIEVMTAGCKDVLDSGILKAADRVEVAASITVTRPW